MPKGADWCWAARCRRARNSEKETLCAAMSRPEKDLIVSGLIEVGARRSDGDA